MVQFGGRVPPNKLGELTMTLEAIALIAPLRFMPSIVINTG